MYTLRLLGGLVLGNAAGSIGGRATQKRRLALLTLIATSPSRSLSRDKVIGYLWPDIHDERARHLLSVALHELRKLPGEDLLISRGDVLTLSDALWTDVSAFEEALATGAPEKALMHYGGPFLDGFHLSKAAEFERWADGVRDRLARRHQSALEQVARARMDAGDAPASAALWRQLAALEPFNSRIAAHLIESLAAAGDRGGALQHARLHEALLREEFGAEPESELVALVDRIRTSPPQSSGKLFSLAVSAAAAAAPAEVAESRSRPRSVAILPFVDMSMGGGEQYFSDGLTEEIGTLLAGVAGLHVAARTSAFALRGRGLDVAEVGRTLHVEAVLEGSVRKAGDRLRVTVNLVSTRDGYSLWAGTYAREGGDVFAIQDEIARAVVKALRGHLTEGDNAALVRVSTPNVEAYHLYLKGRFFWYRRTPEAMRQALDSFQQAVGIDPSYAQAYAGIADVYTLLGSHDYGVLRPAEAFPAATAAISRALELDPGLATAHATRGNVHLMYNWDWPAAEQEFQQALQLDPHCVRALHWYSIGLAIAERHSEAVAAINRARELEPLSTVLSATAGRLYYFAREGTRAVSEYHRSLEMDPTFVTAYLGLGLSYVQNREPEKALEAYETAGRLLGGDPTPLLLALIAHTRGLAGQMKEARAALDRLRAEARHRYVPDEYVALACIGLGESAAAIDALERAATNRSAYIPFLGIDPLLDALRSELRFTTLLRTTAP